MAVPSAASFRSEMCVLGGSRRFGWGGVGSTRGAGGEGRLDQPAIVDPLFLFARNRSDRHRDSQRLIFGVDRWGINRLPEFRGNPASPFAAREEVGIGNDDPQQSVIHC